MIFDPLLRPKAMDGRIPPDDLNHGLPAAAM